MLSKGSEGTGPVVSSVSQRSHKASCRRLKAPDAAVRKRAREVRVSMPLSLARIDAGLKDGPRTRLNHKLIRHRFTSLNAKLAGGDMPPASVKVQPARC